MDVCKWTKEMEISRIKISSYNATNGCGFIAAVANTFLLCLKCCEMASKTFINGNHTPPMSYTHAHAPPISMLLTVEKIEDKWMDLRSVRYTSTLYSIRHIWRLFFQYTANPWTGLRIIILLIHVHAFLLFFSNFLFLFRYFHAVVAVYSDHTAKRITQQAHWLHNTQRIRWYNEKRKKNTHTHRINIYKALANRFHSPIIVFEISLFHSISMHGVNCIYYTRSLYLFIYVYPSVHFSMLSRLIVLLRRNHFCLLRDILTAIFAPTHFSLPILYFVNIP